MRRAFLMWIFVLVSGRSLTAADEPPSWFFQKTPAEVAADSSVTVLRMPSGDGDLMQITTQKIAEMQQDKSSNLVWRSALADLAARSMVGVPSYEGSGSGVIVPRLMAAQLEKELPGLELDKVYLVGDEARVMLGTVTVKFWNAPSDEELISFTEILCSHDHVCMKPQLLPVKSDLARFAPAAPGLGPFEMAAKLRSRQQEIEWAEPDSSTEVELFSSVRYPNDPHRGDQWYLRSIRAPEAWSKAVGTARVTIAVIDDGMDISHPDLKDKIVEGYDFVMGRPIRPGEEQPEEQKGIHGTQVAGIAAAATNNQIGIAGVAWNARIMPIRAISATDQDPLPELTNAILWANEHGAQIINVSWGNVTSDQVAYAIETASKRGSLVFCAGGNSGNAPVAFPARLHDCIAVGAVDRDNVRWKYSNFGPGKDDLDVMAPSGLPGHQGDIWTTDTSGDRGYVRANSLPLDASGDYDATFGGTSAATPMVAGAAALVWSEFPLLAASDIKDLLLESTVRQHTTLSRTAQYGTGRLDLLAFLTKAREYWQELLPQGSNRSLARLDAAYWPLPRVRQTPIGERPLQPASERLVLIVPLGQAPRWDELLAAGVAPPSDPTFSSDITDAFVVARDQLKNEKELKALAGSSRLPTIYASYRDGETWLYPNGVVRITPTDDDARHAVYAYRDANGLDVLKEKDGAIRLGVSPQSTPIDVFQVFEELKSRNVGFAEPELIAAPLPAAPPVP
jgi:subtilisin family serine protease